MLMGWNGIALGVILLLCLLASDPQLYGWWNRRRGVQRASSALSRLGPDAGFAALPLFLLALLPLLRLLGAYGLSLSEERSLDAAVSLFQSGLTPEGLRWPTVLPGPGGEGIGALTVWLALLPQFLLGTTALALRLPQICLLLLAMLALWDLVRRQAGAQLAWWCLLLFACAPLLLNETRSDGSFIFILFLSLLILALWMLLRAVEHPKWIFGASALLALSLYTCDLAWYSVPLFFLLSLAVLVLGKRLRPLPALLSLLLFLLLAWPALTTWAVQVFDLPAQRVYGMDVPKIPDYAHQSDGIWVISETPHYLEMNESRTASLPAGQLAYRRIIHNLYRLLEHTLFFYPASLGLLFLFSLPLSLLGILTIIVRLLRRRPLAPRHRPFAALLLALIVSLLPFTLLHQQLSPSHYLPWVLPLVLLMTIGLRSLTRRVHLSGPLLVLLYGISLLCFIFVILS